MLIQICKKNVGKITYASWRNKWNYGWHDSWIMGIDAEGLGEKVNWHESYNLLKKTFIQSSFSQGDKFFKLFLGDQCLGKQCYYHCKYKYDKSSADIRIGYLWGKTYQSNEDGVSGAIAFTENGKEVLEHCNRKLTEHPFDAVAEGQMKACPSMLPLRNKLISCLQDKSKTIDDAVAIMDVYHKRQRYISRIKHPLRTLRSTAGRIKRNIL